MGIFSRFKDIVSANLNAMLDKAEDPEKMIRLMIQEMEETLVELKASCAATIADKMKIDRETEDQQKLVEKWDERARLAVQKGRDDLARDALHEKKRYVRALDDLSVERTRFDELIAQARGDIVRLEEKIVSARQKQRLLIQRHIRAQQKYTTEHNIRRAGSTDAVERFEQFEQKVDRMEAAADLVNPSVTHKNSLDDEFEKLENKESIEKELVEMKKSIQSEANN